MKKLMSVIAALIIAVPLLAACESTSGVGTKQSVGTLGGAVAGGVLGSQVGSGSGQLWAAGVGTLIGALVGSEVGKSLDRADIAYARQAENNALSAPVGEEIHWNNPNTGHSGYVETVREGQSTAGRYCREYQHTIMVGGQQQQAYGTACQQPDGSWEIVK